MGGQQKLQESKLPGDMRNGRGGIYMSVGHRHGTNVPELIICACNFIIQIIIAHKLKNLA